MCKWVAVLSDGTTVKEGEGEYENTPGERTPWFRLTESLRQSNLYLIDLAVDVDGRLEILPEAPQYSLSYRIEGVLGAGGIESKKFTEIRAHYGHSDVVLIVDDEGQVDYAFTDPNEPLASTPRR